MAKTGEIHLVPDTLEELVAKIRRDHIDLTDKEMKTGSKIVADVTAALERLSADPKSVPILGGTIFRAGSFGRRTQAQPLDDLDLFIPLDGRAMRLESPDNVPTRERLVAGNTDKPIGCDTSLHSGDWVDSRAVLDRAVDALPRLPLDTTHSGKNPRGRCAHITYVGINVDLVFVLWSEHPTIDRYHLPSGTDHTWRTANPKNDQDRLSKANQSEHSELLLPTIRCLKAWNDHVCGGRLKSIHLEVLATETLFKNTPITSTVSALTYAFDALPDALDKPCPDPTGLGPDLDSTLHWEDRAWVKDAARKAFKEAAVANKLADTDVAAAGARWHDILLTKGKEAPKRNRGPAQAGRHDNEFGQPAHRCADAKVPPPLPSQRAARPSNQASRRGEYA
ncbi:MAG: hypothetical protein ACRD03_09170 [Acidimicrobiales bacterium]